LIVAVSLNTFPPSGAINFIGNVYESPETKEVAFKSTFKVPTYEPAGIVTAPIVYDEVGAVEPLPRAAVKVLDVLEIVVTLTGTTTVIPAVGTDTLKVRVANCKATFPSTLSKTTGVSSHAVNTQTNSAINMILKSIFIILYFDY
jgi:hypothetical protein